MVGITFMFNIIKNFLEINLLNHQNESNFMDCDKISRYKYLFIRLTTSYYRKIHHFKEYLFNSSNQRIINIDCHNPKVMLMV